MVSLKKIGRLFRIETRFEAWVVIYAIALGAIERGQQYLADYPGAGGWMLFAACTGVVFLAGGKLLDSTPKRQRLAAAGAALMVSDNPPTARRSRADSGSRPWLRKDLRPTTPPSGRRAAAPEDRTRSPDR